MKLLATKLSLAACAGIWLSSAWAQDHFQSVGPTAESYSIIVSSAAIDDNALEPGDEIGVFTSAGLCVGAAALPPLTNIQLAAWKDDPQTPQVIDGYVSGDTMRFRIWDTSAQLELSATAVYQRGNGMFEDGLFAILSLSAIANKPPTISLTGPLQFVEDDSLQIPLLNAAVDPNDPPDSLSWRVESGPNIRAHVDQLTKMLKLASRQNNWFGQDTLKLTVEDSQGAEDDSTFLVSVQPVNDPPILQLPASVTFNEDEVHTLSLDDYVTDVDNSVTEMSWVVSSPDTAKLEARYDAAKQEAQLAPALNWSGRLVLNVAVADPNEASVSGTLPVTVLPVNDPPSAPQLKDSSSTSLKWSKANDPDSGDVVRYLVEIASDISFTLIVVSRETTAEELAISEIGSQLIRSNIYYWRVKAIDQQNAGSEFSEAHSFRYEGGGVITGIEKTASASSIPRAFKLHQSYPNPLHAQDAEIRTTIRFDLPGQEAVKVELSIYNLSGQLVRHLVTGLRMPGAHAIEWDGKDNMGQFVSSGTYLYRLKAGTMAETRHLTVVR